MNQQFLGPLFLFQKIWIHVVFQVVLLELMPLISDVLLVGKDIVIRIKAQVLIANPVNL
jgi:hypothetical protein